MELHEGGDVLVEEKRDDDGEWYGSAAGRAPGLGGILLGSCCRSKESLVR